MFMILHLGLNFVSTLVVNNNSLEDFFRDFCFDVKITRCKSSCTVKRPQAPPFKFNNLFNEQFFFKSIFSRKN